MRKTLRAFAVGRESEDGQAVVLIAIITLAMMMMVGIAIDAGQLYSARRAMQEAADAAAYAGAIVIYQGDTIAGDVIGAATADATKNGYSTGVTVTYPYVDSSHVKVVITQNVKTSLLPGQNALTTVTVRAAAGATALDASDAILVLDANNTPGAFTVNSSGQVQVTGGGIRINSSSSTAGNAVAGANVTVQAPSKTKSVGLLQGGWPSPLTGQPVQPDPFAGYPKPSTTGLTQYTVTPSNPLNPGVYTQSANIGNGAWTFNPGMYIFAGTSINMTTGSMNGSGVTLFITNANYPLAGGTCGSINLGLNASSSLNPPTTGTYKGMLIYFDPACGSSSTLTVANGAQIETSTGTIYVPKGCIIVNGELEASHVVAKCITVNTGGNLEVQYNPTQTANPMLPALSE